LYIRSAVNGRGASAAIPADSLLHRERVLQPGERKIADDHLRHRLEQLELVALFRDPEHDHGLERRTAGERTGDLRNGDHRIFRQAEALARPLPHAVDGLEALGTFPDEREHGFSLSEAALHEKMPRWRTPTASSSQASWDGR